MLLILRTSLYSIYTYISFYKHKKKISSKAIIILESFTELGFALAQLYLLILTSWYGFILLPKSIFSKYILNTAQPQFTLLHTIQGKKLHNEFPDIPYVLIKLNVLRIKSIWDLLARFKNDTFHLFC